MRSSRLTIRQAVRLVDAGLVTCEELASYCHALAVAGDETWRLNAFSAVVPRDELLDHARASDERRRNGQRFSILDGIPISVKANLAVATQPLTAGSRILGAAQKRDTPPCGYDADTVKVLLRDCGALLVGITNMDEFGMGSLGTNVVSCQEKSDFTRNPLLYLSRLTKNLSSSCSSSISDDEMMAKIIRMPNDAILEAHDRTFRDEEEILSPGGSSCGSAASVCHGSSLLSLGTDTGGSVRLPAAWCGIVGLKPSYGLLSRHGVVSYASSFDTVGILAPSIDCAAIALDKLAQRGGRSRDSTASFHRSSLPSFDYSNAQVRGERSNILSDIKVGIPSSFSVKECPQSMKEAWSTAADWLYQHGAQVEEVSTDFISPILVEKSLAAYYVLVSAEASSNLSRYDGFRFGVSVDETDMSDIVSDSTWTPLELQFAATRMKGFGPEVTRRILCGTSVLSAGRFHTYYEAAARLRAALSKQIHSSLEKKVDVLLIPTALSKPCLIRGDPMDSTEMFANDVMTVPASLAGLPAVSVPFPYPEEDIIQAGIQVVASRLREDIALRVGQVLESGIN